MVYSLDAPYIHMSIARNMAEKHAWSISSGEFSPACSSPLWLVLLSLCYIVFGVSAFAPLLLNLAISLVIILTIQQRLLRLGAAPWSRFVGTTMFAMLVALPAVAYAGLEHLLHTVTALLYIERAVNVVMSKHDHAARQTVRLLARSALLVASRYEGLFMVAATELLLARHHRWRTCLVLGLAALFPVVLYGFISHSRGAYFVPSSLIVKGLTMSDFDWIGRYLGGWFLLQVSYAPYLAALIILAVLLLVRPRDARSTLDERHTLRLQLLVVTALVHLNFARVGSMYRSDACLIALLLWALFGAALATDGWLRHLRAEGSYLRRALRVLATAVSMLLVARRAHKAFVTTPIAMRNIYEQQFQMARFMDRYYRGAVVAANDIGAISFFGGAQLLDLWGLAPMQVLRARVAKTYTSDTIESLALEHHAEVAVIYDIWFTDERAPPRSWTRVGTWRTYGNIICGDEVSFYATTPESAARLSTQLREFSPSLPSGVMQSGRYLLQ